MDIESTMQQGDEHRKAKRYAEAIEAYAHAAEAVEVPPAALRLHLARCHHKLGQHAEAARWLAGVVDATRDFLPWQSAASLLQQIEKQHEIQAKRAVKLAVLGSYTTAQLVPMLKLAALRYGVVLETYEADYAQYRQEALDPNSRLAAFEPDFVVLAMHHGEANLPMHSDDPDAAVSLEARRWTELWRVIADRNGARVIMHNFAVPMTEPFGHLAARLPGSRHAMLHALNARLGEAAGDKVTIVDCERIASTVGKRDYFDDKYWHVAKQAVALKALPELARHNAAVLAGDLGLSRKCVVLDLDNTLWGGVIGEDELSGIKLGAGPDGEAFVAFQEHILSLKQRGIILAVCSKNNEADAKEPFEKHPDMRLKLDDIAMFTANWQPKSENIQAIAKTLNIGLDSLVFVDDNPVEREVVRRMIPEVEVITLPTDPSGYVRAVADALLFESSSFTAEDAKKTEQYRAKAEIAELESGAESLEDFYASLEMKAVIAPFDELHMPRIVQLIGKTNQFNLTLRRHTMRQVEDFAANAECVHLYMQLADKFTDHGLVGVMIAVKVEETLHLDTWLMSCRVLGRTAEQAMLAVLCGRAAELGCTAIEGVWIPGPKNSLVEDLYERMGFTRSETSAAGGDLPEGSTIWRYDLTADEPILNEHIEVTPATEERMNVGNP
jgi:FkbH-like protein